MTTATAKPVAAFIDIDRSTSGGLLAAKLSALPQIFWVDREHIDQVLREQQLQTAFAASELGQRRMLGELLRADVLVLLRNAATSDVKTASAANRFPTVELTVCETKSGLRLGTLVLALEAEADVARASAFVGRSLTLLDEPAVDICAVPPFASKNLLVGHDHLKHSYATIVERLLLERKGIAVAAVAEAQAIGQERRLGRELSGIVRQTPLYFLGEFRCDGSGDEERTTIRIVTKRGTEQVSEVQTAGLRPDEVISFLAHSVDELLATSNRRPHPQFDAGAESRQLLENGRAFARVGNWDEAAAMFESGLLLTPEDDTFRMELLTVYSKISERIYRVGKTGPENATRSSLAQYRRGLDLFESLENKYVAKHQPPNLTDSPSRSQSGIGYIILGFFRKRDFPESIHADVEDAEKHTEDMLFRMLRQRAEQGMGDLRMPVTRLISYYWRSQGKRAGDVAFSTIDSLKDSRGATDLLEAFLMHQDFCFDIESDHVRSTLSRLKSLKHPAIDKGLKNVEVFYSRIAEANAKAKAISKGMAANQTPRPAIQRLTFHPIELQVHGGDRMQRVTGLQSIIPAEEKLDIAAKRYNIYVSTEPGKLRSIWNGEAKHYRDSVEVNHVVWDGHYVWALVRGYNTVPRLLAIEPQTKHVVEFSDKDKLPILTAEQLEASPDFKRQSLNLAAIEPGKVCVAGDFGRSWIALVELDTAKRKHVEVIHECRELIDPETSEHWMSTSVAFSPQHMFTLSDPVSQQKRIVIRRWKEGTARLRNHPLIVNPYTKTVTVTADSMDHHQYDNFWSVHQGTLYWAEGNRIGSLPFPGDRVVHYPMDADQWSWVFFLDGQLHHIGREWKIGSLNNSKFELALSTLPWQYTEPSLNGPYQNQMKRDPDKTKLTLQTLFQSSHFGLILVCRQNDFSGTYQYMQVKPAPRNTP